MASTVPENNATVEPTDTTTTTTTVVEAASMAEAATSSPEKKWAGWPGECVFRAIVPVLKVGCIIGRKGDIIKKICEDTKARIRVLEPPLPTPHRIVTFSYPFTYICFCIFIHPLI